MSLSHEKSVILPTTYFKWWFVPSYIALSIGMHATYENMSITKEKCIYKNKYNNSHACFKYAHLCVHVKKNASICVISVVQKYKVDRTRSLPEINTSIRMRV